MMQENDAPHHVLAAPAAEDVVPEVHTHPQHSHVNPLLQDNIQPAIEVVETYYAIHKVLGNVMNGLPDILNSIGSVTVTGAGVGYKLLDVVEGNIYGKKGILTIFTTSKVMIHPSSCTLTEIYDNDISSSDFNVVTIL
jgi:hypothetical protein